MAYRKDDSEEEYEDELVELHEGIVNDDINMLKQVLQSGVDVNQKFSEDVDQQHIDMTPLSLAAALNKVEAVKLLLSYKANVDDTFAALKTTALMTSSFHGHSEIVKLLIKKQANVNAIDVQGSTALGYAFGGTKNFEVISQLLKAGIDVNLKNMLGMNALLLVSGYSNDKLVKMILDAGADANSVNDFNHSALHIVVVGKWSQIRSITGFGKMNSANYGLQRRNMDILLKDWARSHRHLLKNSREDEKLLESIGQFMMEIASRYVEPEHKPDGEDDQETMKKRVEAVWSYRQDKLNETKSKKSGGVIDNLLSCGGKRSKKAKQGELNSRPLNVADQRPNVPADSEKEILDISEKCAKILKYILDAGCETDKVEKTFGMTALDMAILFGDVESTAVLASAGGDPFHLLKMFSLTELQDAITSVNKKRVKEILASDPHIDVNQKFSSFNVTGRQDGMKKDLKTDGLTPIAVAAQLSDIEILDIIKILQKQGGDVNAVGSGGSTPLAEACRVGNLKMVEFLISQGASIELPSPCYDNATPVTMAASNRHYQIVDYLLNKQAKLDKKLSNGKTALILVSENDDKMMIDRILSANLLDNYTDRNGFTYEMAKEFQKPDKNFTLIQRLIAEETNRFKEDNKNMNIQQQPETINSTRPSNYKSQAVDNARVSGPINVGANQTRPQYDFKPAAKHQEESEEEDDEEEEEEEDEEESPPPRLQQQRNVPTQVIQTKKIQQESESEESEDEDEDERAGKKVIKHVTTTRQVTKVVQKPKESSEEEETEEESEEEAPRSIPQKTVTTGKVLSAAAVAQASKQQSISQPKALVPQARPLQPTRPPRPASESEESEEGEEEEEESEEESDEEEMPVKQVNGNSLKDASSLQKPTVGQSKQVQQPAQQHSESEDDDDDDEEEEDERSYTVQQKIVLPSQKIEGRYASRTTTDKQQPSISKRLIETHRLSPINLPPPLPVTSPPQDDDDDDDEEYDEDDVDEEGYGEQFPTRITNLTVSPNKQSKVVTTKTMQGNNSRTVVKKTVVTTTKITGRPRAPIPVESDDDDDEDVDEEYDDDEHPAHGTETDI